MPNDIDDLEGTAFHEAGHAALALILGRPPRSASIVPDCKNVGHVQFDDDLPPEYKTYFGKSEDKRAYIEMRLLITLAGPIAHDIHDPRRTHDSGDDAHDKWAFAVLADHWEATDDERREWIKNISYQCHAILSDHWCLVETVAQALI